MVLIHKEDFIGFICILLLTPVFMVWFSGYKSGNPYIHKLFVLGLPISLAFIIRRMIINAMC
jgi:hypothetical protein